MLYAFGAAVVDGTFSNGCRFPGDPHGPAEEVYNCRCTLVSAIKGFEGDKVTYSPKLGNMSFEEWVREHEKRLDKAGESGIIKAITIDDYELAASGSKVTQEVLDVLYDEIKQAEKSAGIVYSDVLFDSLGGNQSGTFALQTEMLPNGLLRLNVNTDVFAGHSIKQLNQRFYDTETILANSIHDAMIHERGHAKYMKGKSPAEVSKLHNKLLEIHILGVSPLAYKDGAECIAEVEILLERKMPVPDTAMALYNKYVRK